MKLRKNRKQINKSRNKVIRRNEGGKEEGNKVERKNER
jgi:hypothetical protein